MPDAPRDIEIQAAFDVDVHAQPASVCTWTVFEPPAAGTDCVVAANV